MLLNALCIVLYIKVEKYYQSILQMKNMPIWTLKVEETLNKQVTILLLNILSIFRIEQQSVYDCLKVIFSLFFFLAKNDKNGLVFWVLFHIFF